MSYFFVGGSQRTGTYLLQSILCADETTSPQLREAEYIRNLVMCYQSARQDFGRSTADYFDDLNDFARFNSGIVNAVLRRTLERCAPARHLVLKDPHLTMVFPAIGELVTDARFLVMVRDPRDTIASMMEVGERLRERGQQHPVTSHDVRSLCRQYMSFYAPCLATRSRRFRERLIYIAYERLVGDPSATIEALRGFTGLALRDFDPSGDWAPGQIDFEQPDDHLQAWFTELYGKGVSASRVGRYRDTLSESQVSTIERACERAFRAFGYQPTAAQPA